MSHLFTAENAISLLTLTLMEIVLGIDNIVFIALLTQRLPEAKRKPARQIGMALALGLRLGLLFTLSWIMRLTQPLFTIMNHGFSGRDLVLLGGGLFLIAKSTHEIHNKMEGDAHEAEGSRKPASFTSIIVQILILDIVFSLDSVITAVGMAQHLEVMVVAMIIAVGVMILSASAVSNFIHRHPTMKVLALSFLLLIGVLLTVEGLGKHVAKGYIYFAMAFSFAVELLNIRMRKPKKTAVLSVMTEPPTVPERGTRN